MLPDDARLALKEGLDSEDELVMVAFDKNFQPEQWGFIPSFLSGDDLRPVKEQFNEHYVGGWRPMDGFKMDRGTGALKYPGDPSLKPLSAIIFRKEMILLYPHDFVAIVQIPGDAFEVARMD